MYGLLNSTTARVSIFKREIHLVTLFYWQNRASAGTAKVPGRCFGERSREFAAVQGGDETLDYYRAKGAGWQ